MRFDSHLHIARIGNVKELERCGVKWALCVSENVRDLRTTLSMAKTSPGILPFAGTHPRVMDISDVEEQARYLGSVVGIGEVGLDFAVARIPELRRIQEAIFRAWLQIGESHGMPIIVHTRHAEKAVLRILKEYRVVTVLHAYSGPIDIARELAGRGHFFSFPPVPSPARAKLIRLLPLDRILVESDAPYIASPCDVEKAVRMISRERGIPLDKMTEILWENLAMFLGRSL